MKAMMLDRPETTVDVPEDVASGEEPGCPACWFVAANVAPAEVGSESITFVQIDDGRIVEVTETGISKNVFCRAMVCSPITLNEARKKIAARAPN